MPEYGFGSLALGTPRSKSFSLICIRTSSLYINIFIMAIKPCASEDKPVPNSKIRGKLPLERFIPQLFATGFLTLFSERSSTGCCQTGWASKCDLV